METKQIKCYCGHTIYCDCSPLEEPKQETLEELGKTISIKDAKKDSFEDVTKYKIERMYSEEDMRKCWNAAYIDALAIDEEIYKPLFFEDFIEQFKKQ